MNVIFYAIIILFECILNGTFPQPDWNAWRVLVRLVTLLWRRKLRLLISLRMLWLTFEFVQRITKYLFMFVEDKFPTFVSMYDEIDDKYEYFKFGSFNRINLFSVNIMHVFIRSCIEAETMSLHSWQYISSDILICIFVSF